MFGRHNYSIICYIVCKLIFIYERLDNIKIKVHSLLKFSNYSVSIHYIRKKDYMKTQLKVEQIGTLLSYSRCFVQSYT